MRVTKIKKLKGYGVFREYSWPNDLSDFKRFNLIYGWNGSGKTLLSNVFRALEEQKELEKCDDVKIELDDKSTLSKEEFEAKGKTLRIKVFNRDYIKENVFNDNNTLGHIFFLGKEDIEKQKEVSNKKRNLRANRKLLSEKKKEKKELDDTFNKFKTDSARAISDSMVQYKPSYKNYNSPKFRLAVEKIIKEGYEPTDIDSSRLIETISAGFNKCNSFSNRDAIKQELVTGIETICITSIATKIIKMLEENEDISNWVRGGLELHGKHGKNRCLFCKQEIPPERLTELDKHFNKEYQSLLSDVDAKLSSIERHIVLLGQLTFLDSRRIYPELRDDYTSAKDWLIKQISSNKEILLKLKQHLTNKRSNPFTVVKVEECILIDLADKFREINEILSKHNINVERQSELAEKAISELEKYRVHQYIKQYQYFETQINDLDDVIDSLNTTITTENQEITLLEQEIVQHLKPAKELNKELESYLGHSELRFEVNETGYQIFRGEELATSISEGERTAIAFLYFLKTLEDKDFDISNGIVVIDDPMSSLDSNNLYSAFSYMKERVKEAGQLFLLTHSFQFFHIIKRWLESLKQKQKVTLSIKMLKIKGSSGCRDSSIINLPALLNDYESEYHYLFGLVYVVSNEIDSTKDCSIYYQMPNIARRLLEAYLGFRVPTTGSLHSRLMDGVLSFSREKKDVIYRFCNKYSHKLYLDLPEHDLSLLSETPRVMGYLMEFIRETDAEHFRQMESVVLVNNKGT